MSAAGDVWLARDGRVHVTGGRTWVAIAVLLAGIAVQGTVAQNETRGFIDAQLIVGHRTEHVVAPGETLTSVGARYGMTPRVVAATNGLRADARLQIGQRLVADSRHLIPAFTGERLLINVPQRMLFLLEENGAITGFPIAVGRSSWRTFRGPFTVETLETDPVWDVPASIQEEQRRAGTPVLTHVPPGPHNPLGAYWIGLSRPGFGIHSTNAPASIYGFVTHGCIRLHPDDATYVFTRAAVGMFGRSTYEPVLFARMPDGTNLLEAHPDAYRLQPDALAEVRARAIELEVAHAVDWQAVAAVLRARDGAPTDVSLQPTR